MKEVGPAFKGGRTNRWFMAGLLLVSLMALWPALHPALQTLAADLYAKASTFGSGIVSPLNALRLQAGTSLLVPFLLGLMAVTAPCQLSTGTAALAFVLRDPASGQALSQATAFLVARVVMYSLMGLMALLFFDGHLTTSGEGLTLLRRLIGPLMAGGGLVMLGWVRPRLSLGVSSMRTLDRLARVRGGISGAFLLGVAFSLSFCPTLFFLFFGLTVPMSLTAPFGLAYPALFALGMTFPLLVVSTLFTGQSTDRQKRLIQGTRRSHRVLMPLSGIVFLLAGLYDTFIYWLM